MFRILLQPLSYFLINDYRYYYYYKMRGNLYRNRDIIINYQKDKLKKLIFHAYRYTPFYSDLFKSKGIYPSDIRDLRDLRILPVMTKDIIKKNTELLKSTDSYGKGLEKVTSGGSTGKTSVIYKSKYFTQMSRAAFLRNNLLTGWKPHDKSFWIWGAPYEHQKIKDSIISRIGIRINSILLLNAYNYSPNDFVNWVKRINFFRPKVLYGYSSIILEFARFCLINNIYFPSIKRVVSTTEKLLGRKIIEEAFKCKVYDQYGCREVLSIATECKNGNMHISDDTVILEEENGRLLVTALDSFGFPLIRYEVGDIGGLKSRGAICSCGCSFSLLDLEIGRITDNFKRYDGRKVSASALATYISKLELKFKEYQIIQKEIDLFEVNYIPISGYSKNDNDLIEKVLYEYFGIVNIKFKKVKNIPIEKSGKRLLFKCSI